MNPATHTKLKTIFLASLLFALIATPSSLTAVAAKPSPAKAKAKPQAKKPQAQLHSKLKPKTDVKAGRNEKVATLRDVRNSAQSSGSKRQLRAAAQRAAEARRQEARRQAEANRQAAIARQRAADAEMRNEAQGMIARDNTEGEDLEVRAVAVKALGNHAGTVVVMDPKTGRVYSMVNQEWAVRRGFKPCSTIKLVTGLAGLNEGVIDQSNVINASGSDHINLTKALAYSKNGYFQQVGGRVGFDKMISYSRQLGLGEKTGINSPNEFKGQVPSPRSGSADRIYSHGDDFKVTPLQLATLVSAMANGGKLLTPRIPTSAQEEAALKPRVRRVVNINADTFASMIPGMVGAVDYGSGRKAHHSGSSVAGKTGTCIEQGTWIGLFASYAPLANPRLAVVVIARGPDARGHFPAAVAGRIYRDLNSRFGTPTYLPVASNPARSTVDEEEGMDTGDERVPTQTRATESVETFDTRSSNTNLPRNTVRRVLMTIPKVTEEPVKPAPTRVPNSLTRPRRVSQL